MKIERIHIDSFMGKKDFSLEFASGINIIRGDNESGKSSVAEFIKFMLYGASARGSSGEVSERAKYLSFGETSFGGQMELQTKKGRYRIDRTVVSGQSGFRESLSITDLEKKTTVFKGENAGEALLGIPEEVFEKAAYISQEKEGYTGGSDLGNAIENLLFAADETVSTDKAVKKLDALRVSLLHKNGRGGLLFTLANEREGLEQRLSKALSENSEIIAKEGSLAETETRIAEKKAEYTQCKKLCELYDNYIALTRFRKKDELLAEKSAAEEELRELDARFDGFAPDGEYLGRLRLTKEQLTETADGLESATAALENASKARAAAEDAAGARGEDTDFDSAVKKAKKMEKTSSFMKVFGIILICLSVISAATVYLMLLDGILYAASAGIALVGALLIVFGGSFKKKLRHMLENYGVSTSYALVDKQREESDAAKRAEENLTAARAEESAAAARLNDMQARYEKLKEEFAAEALRLKGDDTDSDALFAAIENYIADGERVRTELKLLTDRITTLQKETASYDRETVEKMLSAINDLSVFEKLDINEYKRNRDFCENAIAALEIKKGDLEKSLAALHATVEPSAIISAALAEVKKKEKAAKAKYDAATLAIKSIENASRGLRTRVSPRLAEYAGKLLSVMTDGKYTEIGVDDEMNMTFLAKDGAHDISYLSKGTRESAYFALRLALEDLLCKEEKVTLVLDESFAHADNERTKQSFRILAALAAEGTQSIVLACHDREEKIAEKVSVVNLIEI